MGSGEDLALLLYLYFRSRQNRDDKFFLFTLLLFLVTGGLSLRLALDRKSNEPLDLPFIAVNPIR
jgi:hypothetical protein